MSRSSTTVFSIYLALKTNSVQLKTQLCIFIPLNLLNVIAPVSEVSSCDYSNHLKCSFPARTCLSLVPKAFISKASSIRPQHKTHLSPAIYMFVCNIIRIWSWVTKTISLLVMNRFVCNVKSYSEVSSRDYFVASDKGIHLLFGSGFRNPPKKNRN